MKLVRLLVLVSREHDMTDAELAIIDLKEAILEYGSTITLNIITEGAYNPVTGDTDDTITPHPMKALPKNYTSKELESPDIYVKDIKFMLYFDGEIDYTDNLIFNGNTYNFLNIDKMILQDETLVYKIQGRV